MICSFSQTSPSFDSLTKNSPIVKVASKSVKQECIPVGCVPSAAMASAGGGGSTRVGVSGQGGVCLGVSARGCLPNTPRGQNDKRV